MATESIKSDKEYKDMLLEIESLMFAEIHSPEGLRLDTLVALVEAYEHERFSISEDKSSSCRLNFE